MKTMRPISRKRGPAVTAKLEQVFSSDRAWFDAHPDETEYIRDFAPGEFPAEELPVLPPGFTRRDPSDGHRPQRAWCGRTLP